MNISAAIATILNELPHLRHIRDLARDVRAAQKKYFKTRSRDDLIESKQLEAKLDKALNESNERKLPDTDNDEVAR